MTIAEMKAHHDKINAQIHEAKALIEQIEAHAQKNKAQSEIEKLNDLKTKRQEIEKKWHKHLKTAGEVALAVKVKSDVESELAKLKGSLEEVSAQVQSQAQAS